MSNIYESGYMKRSGSYEKSKIQNPENYKRITNIFCQHIKIFRPEMGPYGSVGAHIKTGKRYMAQDHFVE